MSSYRQIFKSTALVGGAQVFMILIGIVRTKALALLLGPSGIGTAGLYQSATALIANVSGMGIGVSGVRQIADAAASNDSIKISRTIIALRRTSAIAGFIGLLAVLALSVPLSRLSFEDESHATGIAIMSLSVFFAGLTAGQTALLQGLRRLRDMAMASLLGSLLGAAVSIALVWFLRERGIALYLVAVSACGLLASWWFARRVPLEPVSMSWRETWAEARPLLALGLAFMVSGLFSMAGAYASNLLIRRELGSDILGLYQATWTLSNLYVGIVLSAMGADFAPRLTAAINDHPVMNRLVNEQTEMGLLIAVPGVLATITLAPWVLMVFYSSEFVGAAEIIRWQIIGIALRVVSWPMGLVLVAKGKGRLFMASEGIMAVLNVSLLAAGMKLWGAEGIGISFALYYLIFTAVILAIVRSLSGFAWSARCVKVLVPSIIVTAAAFAAARFLPQAWALVAGAAVTAAASYGCLIGLQKLLQVNAWQYLKRKAGFAS